MFSRKTKVILDTNILMLPGKGIDIFAGIEQALSEPYELCTYEGVLSELLKLAENKSKDAFNAKLGYIMAKQKALKILSSSSKEHIDDVIVEKNGPKDIVVTQDADLIRRLSEKGIRILRHQQHAFVFQRG